MEGGHMRSRRYLPVFFFIALILFPFSSEAAQDDLVGSIIAKQKQIKTLVAGFSQEKHSQMLADPLVSEGVFKYKAPEKVLWFYKGQLKIVSNGKKITVYYTELNEAEIVPVEKSLIRLPLNFNLEEFKRYFSVSAKKMEKGYSVTLVPLDDGSMFTKMTIQLRKDGVPEVVEMFEKAGDRSVIRFRDQKVNSDIPDNEFVLDLPENVTIRRFGEQ